MEKKTYFAGIDVQISRGCAYYIIDEKDKFVDSGWVRDSSVSNISNELYRILSRFSSEKIAIGIDAPRKPLQEKRKFKWDGKRSVWVKNDASSKGYGKHAEIIIKSAGLGNPQWTPTLKDSPDWMKLGYSIFNSLKNYSTFEVFPSASYKLFENSNESRFEISLKYFSGGPKDMLDAAASAFTVKQFISGTGEEVGGADGLGSIILPAKISNSLPQNLLKYPN